MLSAAQRLKQEGMQQERQTIAKNMLNADITRELVKRTTHLLLDHYMIKWITFQLLLTLKSVPQQEESAFQFNLLNNAVETL
ncbi:MAG: hypothetical protein AB2989_07285 [Candidatus Symbiodolus clandestinus]